MEQPRVTVIVAVRDAEATLERALESIRAQSEERWEAIVVDDGSTDATAEVAQRAAGEDGRIRVVRRPAAGVSAARNAGLAAARGAWVLFLDADDWLEPRALELLGDALAADPAVDVAYGAWSRITELGRVREQTAWPEPDALFAVLARRSVLPINTVLFRRSLTEGVGGFDTELATGEDWDFWQRLARCGARFALVPQPVAVYRFRRESASNVPERLLAGAVEVIGRGHRPDPRVRSPHRDHAAGRPPQEAPSAVLIMACWCAGLAIGRAEGASRLLEAVPTNGVVDVDPRAAGETLLDALTLVSDDPCAALADSGEPHRSVRAFLDAVEERTQAPGWSVRALRAMDDAILDRAAVRPLRAGGALAISLELTEPLAEVVPPSGVERLRCDVTIDGEPLGSLELPVCDGTVPAWVIADAAAAAFFWDVLGRFFSRTVYPDLLVQTPGGHTLQRGALELAGALPASREDALAQAHEHAGWTVFLQELWGRPEWPEGRFYEGGEPSPDPAARPSDGWFTVEASLDGRRRDGGRRGARGGPHGRGRAGLPCDGPCPERRPDDGGRPARGAHRRRRTRALPRCRPRGAAGPAPRRAGIASRAARARRRRPAVRPSTGRRAGRRRAAPRPGLERGDGDRPGRRVGRAAPGPPWGAGPPRGAARSGGRRADRRRPCGGRAGVVRPAGARPERVAYLPELLWRPAPSASPSGGIVAGQAAAGAPSAIGAAAPEPRHYDRHAFEALFAGRADPWRDDTPYEQGKYDQTLALLPRGRIGRALEAGCAEGHFTVRLAPRVGELVAADISSLALERAAERCAGLANVSFERLDLAQDALPGRFDLIVASEVLYYVGDLAACTARLAGALAPGGLLLAAHGNVVADDPSGPGFAWDVAFGARTIGEVLAAAPGLRLLRELRTPYYRIQLLRRERPVDALRRRRPAKVIDAEARAASRPAVAAAFRPRGGEAPPPAQAIPVTTERLPILMYHRVADDGPRQLERYRVTPRAFDEQIRYLRRAGFRGVSLAEWATAVAARRPLAGRAVAITFDDGYLDFLTAAWPILRRHGFAAEVFLVTDLVGATSRWDLRYGETAPLLDWEQVTALEDEGVRFGSHTAGHRSLTALPADEVVRECARSRSVLHERLSHRPTAIAYPGGDVDRAIAHLAGACGYGLGLTSEPGRARLAGDPLLLPRIEVTGSLSHAGFVAALG